MLGQKHGDRRVVDESPQSGGTYETLPLNFLFFHSPSGPPTSRTPRTPSGRNSAYVTRAQP